ncbi:MAG: hypothetical protein J0M04_04145 [Verrucomicrobia bacterium]|nr:hypothetical protein [Verrucomicrobiota bacterium]
MPFRNFLLPALAVLTIGMPPLVRAADRSADWKKVRDAVESKQAKTTVELLKPLEAAAFADQAWGEGAKAVLMRVRIENGLGFPEAVFVEGETRVPSASIEQDPFANRFDDQDQLDSDPSEPGGLPGGVRQLEKEIPLAPDPVKPILRLFQARWLMSYAEADEREILERKHIPQQELDRIERWNAPRIHAEIERHFRQALEAPSLRTTPVAAFREILGPPGAYGDLPRPTLYDIAAHALADFLTSGLFGSPWNHPLSDIPATAPIFGIAAEFLAWKPAPSDSLPAETRALAIYQDLMMFHRDDKDRTAFLHCDLERLRWAGRFACGTEKPKRQLAAFQSFIRENIGHPLSADARHDEVLLLQMGGRAIEAHASAKAGAEAFPKHPAGKVCMGLMREMEQQELKVETPRSWPPTGDEISVTQRNSPHLWFRLCRREWKPDLKKLERDPRDYERIDIAKWLNREPTYQWDAVLDSPTDYSPHFHRVRTPENLAPGSYVLLVSCAPGFEKRDLVNYAPVWVSNLRIEDDSLVMDSTTGAPKPDVRIDVWQKAKGEPVIHQVLKTDNDGRFNFKTQHGERTILIQATRENDRAIVYSTFTGQLDYNNTDPDHHEAVIFHTDRSIYRPGQQIQFKGILAHADDTRNEYHTLANRDVTVTLTGSNENKVASTKFRTNDMGSFAGSFTAPTAALLGQFTLEAEDLGKETIRVEEYKRPKFEVSLIPPDEPVELGAKMTVKGTAKTYTGAPLDGAEVEWAVDRFSYFAGIGDWLGWNQNSLDTKTIALGKTVTGADGSFTITFIAEPDAWLPSDKDPVFEYTIGAKVTDATGETQHAGASASAAYSRFAAEMEVADWQEAGKPVSVKITTATVNAAPFPATGTLRVYQLVQPETCPRDEFTGDGYFSLTETSRPGPAGWKTGEAIRKTAVATERKGDESFAIVPVDLPAGCYRLVFEAADAGHNKVTAIRNVHVFDLEATRFPTKTPFFVAVPDGPLEPGRPANLVWGSGYETAHALVEWYRDDTLLKREWSRPGTTQQIFSLPTAESLRGGVEVRVHQYSNNRRHSWAGVVEIPWSNKELSVKWEHNTSKLQPGANETWTAVITGPDGKPASAEMVATLYDASLDDLTSHAFAGVHSLLRDAGWERGYDERNWWDFASGESNQSGLGYRPDEICHPFRDLLAGLDESSEGSTILVSSDGRRVISRFRHVTTLDTTVLNFYEPPELPNSVGTSANSLAGNGFGFPVTPATPSGPTSPEEKRENLRLEALRRELAKVASRRKLDETAFFYPQLATDKDGKIRMTFTMPEGLGRWKFLGFAHDKELRSGHLEGETVTAKDLMVQPNPPRFLREGDTLDFTVRLSNQSDREQSGLAKFTLSDVAGAADLTAALGVASPEQAFAIPAKQSRTLAWRLTVPDGCGFLRYQARAACGDLTDGEEGWLPVLPRLVPATDSMAITLRTAGETKCDFASLAASGKSDTLRHDSLQVQVVSRPAWYAVMALPYLMEFPHECAEQTFSRLYANAMGHKIVTSDPKVRRVFEVWRATGTPDSPLRKNQELANMMLEETPWLRDAGDDTARRQRVALLFDDNRMADEIAKARAKLKEMQLSNGMWPWFPGGLASESITAHIVAGYGELRAAGVEVDTEPAIKGATALDGSLTEVHRQLIHAERKAPGTLNENHLSPFIVHALYSRSFFLNDRKTAEWDQDSLAYFIAQGKQHWNKLNSRLTTAQLALALWRHGEKDTARLITRAFRETAVNHPQTGMSWPAPPGSGWWWDAPVETQAAMIAAFGEIDGDAKAVDDCRAWIIHQHRDGDWQTTTATAAAIHALLVGPVGPSPLASDALVRVALGGRPLDPGKPEPGTGYYEHRIPGTEVKPEMASLTLTNPDPGVAWVNLHWRYFEDPAKLASHESGGLKIEKHLLVRRQTPAGPKEEPVAGQLHPGDELITRLVVTSARELEFVHLKDDRGSGTEPANVLSGYRWNNGVGYYESTRDSATHIFIDSLPKGTHVFEHVSRVQHAGTYQTGPATIRCMYAPEFMARSASVKVESIRNP